MNSVIEYATTDDVPAMADLLTELFTLETDFQPDREKQLAGLKLIIDEPAMGQLFVVRVNAMIVGMANALITFSTAEGGRVVLMEDVIIKTEYRGRGFGTRLVKHVLAWAKNERMTRVTLLADKGNALALSFYERMGFQPSAMTVLRRTLD
ncbi:MAG: GNAT family N-acetyltransferase [Thiobacillaceae bacterium]